VATEAPPLPRPLARRVRARALLAPLLAAWLAVGVAGAREYVGHYFDYRGFPPPVTPSGVPAGQVRQVWFFSRALGRRASYLVYTPPGYAAAAARGARFPAVYLLHPPPGVASVFFSAGAAAVDADVLLHRHRIRPMLLVVPNGQTSAYANDTEWANARAGRYEDFVLDVVHAVDRRFATAPARRERVLAGLSEGGYGAVNVTLHHLRDFGGVQSWSGYYRNSVAYSHVLAGLSPGALAYDNPAELVPAIAGRIRALGLHAFLYTGRQDHEPGHPELYPFAAELRRAGAQTGVAVYEGGHDWQLWRREMPHMLELASTWFGGRP
jgi:enterochelin esterase-like enzyme